MLAITIALFVVPHNQQIVTIRQFFTYRIPLFRNQNLNILKELLTQISKDNGFQILEMNIEKDHIRMLINCTPQHYIPNIIKAMKGVSARLLMKEFGDDLRSKLWGGHLWNPSYFVATVSENTEEQIIEYIRSQKRK